MSREITFQDIQDVRKRARQSSAVAVVTGDVVQAETTEKEQTQEESEE